MANYLHANMENHHSGIADALTVSNIVTKMLERGFQVAEEKFFEKRKAFILEEQKEIIFTNKHATEEEITVEMICDAFQFSEEDVLNLYFCPYIGPQSREFNFIIVLKEYSAQNGIFRRNMFSTIFDVSSFVEEVEEKRSLTAVYVQLCKEYGKVLKEKVSVEAKIGVRDFRMLLIGENGKSLARANKSWEKKKLLESDSNIVHLIKLLIWGVELAKKGEFTDLKAGDEFKNSLESLEKFKDFNQFESQTKKIREELYNQMKKILHESKHEMMQLEEKLRKKEGKKLMISKLLESFADLGRFCVFSNVVKKRHPNHSSSLVHLSNVEQSVLDMESVRECNGIILQLADFAPVCVPPKTFFPSSQVLFYSKKSQMQLLELEGIQILKDTEGTLFTLYFYQGQFFVSTNKTANAMEKILEQNNDSPKTACELFWEIWKKKDWKLPVEERGKYSFTFLLKSNFNCAVSQVNEGEERMFLFYAFDLSECREERNLGYFCEKYGWEKMEIVELSAKDLKSKETMQIKLDESLVETNPSQVKGFILIDKHNMRCTFNSIHYEALLSLRINPIEGANLYKNLLILIIHSVTAELVSKVCKKMVFDKFVEMKSKYEDLISKISSTHEKCKQFLEQNDQKGFSSFVTNKENKKYSKFLFAMKNGNLEDPSKLFFRCGGGLRGANATKFLDSVLEFLV